MALQLETSSRLARVAALGMALAASCAHQRDREGGPDGRGPRTSAEVGDDGTSGGSERHGEDRTGRLRTVSGDVDDDDGAADGRDVRPAIHYEPWPFRAASVRLHPLTHAVLTADGRPLIEARIEFLDAFDHNAKGLGFVRFDLVGSDRRGRRLDESEPGGGPLGRWEVDLNDLETNLLHYDEITRTYLFRLELDPALASEEGAAVGGGGGAESDGGERITAADLPEYARLTATVRLPEGGGTKRAEFIVGLK